MNSNSHQTSFYRTFEVSQKSKLPYSVLYSSIGIESNESGGVPIAMCHILRNFSKISPLGKYSFCFFGFSCFQIFHDSSQSFLWMSWNKNSICQHKRSYFFLFSQNWHSTWDGRLARRTECINDQVKMTKPTTRTLDSKTPSGLTPHVAFALSTSQTRCHFVYVSFYFKTICLTWSACGNNLHSPQPAQFTSTVESSAT